MLLSRVRRLCSAPIGRLRPTPRRSRRLTLEALEDRLTPSPLGPPGPPPCPAPCPPPCFPHPGPAHVLAVDQCHYDDNFHSIQAAIDAADPGDTILVRPGVYQEQLTIDKSINLIGACGRVTIMSPQDLGTPTADNPGAIIHVLGPDTFVNLSRLTISGGDGGAPNLLYGVRVDGNGYADLQEDTVTNIIDASDSTLGVAVDAGNTAADGDPYTGDQVGSIQVVNSCITNYQLAGIVVSNVGSRGWVFNNHISGGPASNAAGLAGVEVVDGAVANIQNNCISGDTNGADGSGVLLYNAGVQRLPDYDSDPNDFFITTVRNNTISNNDYGVVVSQVANSLSGQPASANIVGNRIFDNTFVGIELANSSNVVVAGNQLWGNGSQNAGDGGIYLFQSTNNFVIANRSDGNNGSGIYVDAGSTGNLLRDNVTYFNVYSVANGSADAVDLSSGTGTAGTANLWIHDLGRTYIDDSGETLFSYPPRPPCPPPGPHHAPPPGPHGPPCRPPGPPAPPPCQGPPAPPPGPPAPPPCPPGPPPCQGPPAPPPCQGPPAPPPGPPGPPPPGPGPDCH